MASDEPQQKKPPDGIRCPKCNCAVSSVYYTRPRKGVTRRVRICGSPICGHKYPTRESVTGGNQGESPVAAVTTANDGATSSIANLASTKSRQRRSDKRP